MKKAILLIAVLAGITVSLGVQLVDSSTAWESTKYWLSLFITSFLAGWFINDVVCMFKKIRAKKECVR